MINFLAFELETRRAEGSFKYEGSIQINVISLHKAVTFPSLHLKRGTLGSDDIIITDEDDSHASFTKDKNVCCTWEASQPSSRWTSLLEFIFAQGFHFSEAYLCNIQLLRVFLSPALLCTAGNTVKVNLETEQAGSVLQTLQWSFTPHLNYEDTASASLV